MRRVLGAFLLWIGLAFPAFAIDHYWVGGGSSTNWSATVPTNWALTSGGAGGATVPSTGDKVFFDANSGAGTSTIDAGFTNVPSNIDFTGFVGTLAGSDNLAVASTSAFVFKFGSGMTQSWTGNLSIGGASGGTFTLTSAGKSFGGSVSGVSAFGNSITLQDALNLSGALSFGNTTGLVFDANGFSITAGSMNISSSNTRTITLGGNVTLTSTGNVWIATTTTNLTFNKNFANIKITDNSSSAKGFLGGGLTYNDVWYAPGTGTGQFNISGANTYANFKDDGTVAHTIRFPISVTQTFSAFTVTGNSGQLISLISSTSGTAATLSMPSGTVSSDFLSIKDSTATGGAAWYAGANSTDVSGNSGWIFTAAPIVSPASRQSLLGVGK